MSQIPPLKALHYFDTAMRENSFSLAAQELCVTPGAVGQQIRKLEEWLGISLFTRHIRQLQPTADGLAYWARIQPALAQISSASRLLRDSRSNGVWVNMPPSFAARWFARRMSGFVARNPEVALHLNSSAAVVDFNAEPVDLAVRYFDGNDPALEAHLLCNDDARVYCSPEYATRLNLRSSADVGKATLLHNTLHPHWENWLQRFSGLSAKAQAAIPGLYFDQSLVAIEAASRHQGVLLTSALLTEEEVAAGSLIEAFSDRLLLSKGYYVVHPQGATLRPAVQALKQWLIDEAQART
ncbi:MAG: LysR substrate-binding domain-containing protein [Pseudomonas sp.]|uniref:LysR substrate-binding domain-containing protein n=1 Tax=Pseudomonas sp. TaxID=306 RepID=UPI0030F13854